MKLASDLLMEECNWSAYIAEMKQGRLVRLGNL